MTRIGFCLWDVSMFMFFRITLSQDDPFSNHFDLWLWALWLASSERELFSIPYLFEFTSSPITVQSLKVVSTSP